MLIPDFISIGHACHDTAPSGFLPGGAVTYSGLFAKKLGLETGVLTSFGKDFLFEHLFEGIQVATVPADQTTIFQNLDFEHTRQQYLLARAGNIKTAHLPQHWKKAKMVFIAPIANEVAFDYPEFFEDSIICINPQGWMRRWDDKGKVSYKVWDDYDLLSKADIVIISEEDVGREDLLIKKMASQLKTLVVTKGKKGCDLYLNNQKSNFPAFETTVIDTTGAGDIFSAAFLIFYHRTRDFTKAAQYANVAASFCVEGREASSLPMLSQIEERFTTYLKKFNAQ